MFRGGASGGRGLGFGTGALGLLRSPPDREAWLPPAEFLASRPSGFPHAPPLGGARARGAAALLGGTSCAERQEPQLRAPAQSSTLPLLPPPPGAGSLVLALALSGRRHLPAGPPRPACSEWGRARGFGARGSGEQGTRRSPRGAAGGAGWRRISGGGGAALRGPRGARAARSGAGTSPRRTARGRVAGLRPGFRGPPGADVRFRRTGVRAPMRVPRPCPEHLRFHARAGRKRGHRLRGDSEARPGRGHLEVCSKMIGFFFGGAGGGAY